MLAMERSAMHAAIQVKKIRMMPKTLLRPLIAQAPQVPGLSLFTPAYSRAIQAGFRLNCGDLISVTFEHYNATKPLLSPNHQKFT